MPGGLVLALVVLALTGPAAAQTYRCPGPDGAMRFTDDPSACPGAKPYEIRGAIQRAQTPHGSGDPSAPTGRAPGVRTLQTRALHAFFPPLSALGAGWELVKEAPEDPAADPELWGAGLRAVAARHYAQGEPGRSRVCSVEIWAFSNAEGPGRVSPFVARPKWQLHSDGNLLVILRGVTLSPSGGFQPGIFSECQRIGELTHARVAAAGR